MRRRLAALGLGLLLALAAGETVCRIAGLDGQPDLDPAVLAQRRQAREASIFQASDDPLLIYTLRPNYSSQGVPLTESGGILRETDVPVAKPPDVARIVVLGDSIAAMLARKVHYRTPPFPDRLESILNGRPGARRVEVLNFGTDGYGTLQEARLLETRAVRYDPDVVLVEFCYNDPGANVTPAIWFLEPEEPWSYLLGYVASKLRSGTPDDLDPHRALTVPDRGPTSPETWRHWERLYDPESASWARVESGFGRIAAVARERAIPVVLVVFPLLVPQEEGHVAAIREQVLACARRHGLTIVDLLPAFSRHPLEELQEFPGLDPYHPSVLGQRIAARAIAGVVADLPALK